MDNAAPFGGSDERRPVWSLLCCKNRFTERWLGKQRIHDKDSVIEEPCAGKLCAVSRTDGIATRGGRSSGFMTPRRTTDLDPKGRGDKSMLVKQGTAEDVYSVVLQRLSDRAKTGLFEPQSPGVEPHTRR